MYKEETMPTDMVFWSSGLFGMMKQKWSIDDEGIQNNDTKIKYEDIQEARLQRECSPGICDGCISIKAQGRVYSLLYINRDREEAHKALQYINEHYGSVEERQKRSEKKENAVSQ